MYRLLVLLFLFSPTLNAQIQFWTKDAIIETQFEPALKAMAIKTAYNYITNENGAMDDSTRYNEITQYNSNGQKTVYMKYKTDWNKKIRYYQTIDSIFFTDKGIFSQFKRYTPIRDGKEYQCTYRATSTLNKKGLIERIDYYGGYMASELNSYELHTYDTKNRLLTVVKYTKDDKEDYKWVFEYNKKNRITKVTTASAWGGNNTYALTYTTKGLLSSYTELYEGKEQKKDTFTYDAKNRLTKREQSTTTGHFETMEYSYADKNSVPHQSHLQYPRGYGSSDIAHEYLTYKFEFFE